MLAASALVLLLLAVALLAAPLQMTFHVRGIEALEGRITVRGLFGLLRVNAEVPGAPGPGAKIRRRTQAPRPARGRLNPLPALSDAAFRRRCLRFAGDVLGALHLHRLRLQLRLGLGDPADTGRLWAWVGPLGAVADGWRGAEVRIQPDFTDAVIDFDLSGRMRLIPLQLMAIMIGFAVAPVSIRAWRRLSRRHE